MAENKGSSKSILMLDPKDNIAVCLRDITAGEQVTFSMGNKAMSAKVVDPIPRGHKICVKEIKKGTQIIKYGEIIGKATKPIHVGQHVHVHNVTDY